MRRDRESAFSQLIARATRAIPPTVQKKLRPFFSWIPDAWTQSAVYRQALSEMRAADQWNLKQTEQFQLARLRRMIAHASHYAPAYTRRFAEQGLSRWTLSGLRDLEKFPFLFPNDLRAAAGVYRAMNMHHDDLTALAPDAMSGVSAPFFQQSEDADVLLACERHSRRRFGVDSTRARILDLSTSVPGGPTRRGSPNVLTVSISALAASAFPQYLAQIQKFSPQAIVGFPSSVAAFATRCRSANVTLPVSRIFLHCERLYPDEREIIENAFYAPLAKIYERNDSSGFAVGCARSRRYHFLPTVGLVELVDAQGRSLYKEGDRGEIVLTGLKSWTTPLIRYRTGTFGVWGPSPCPSCGQASQTLEEMDEPPKEFLIDSEGHAVPFAALHFKEPLLCATEQFDYVQDAPGRLTLRLVPSNTWSQEFIEPLRRSMLARLGAAFTLEVAVVDHIAPAALPLDQRISFPHQGQSRASA